MRRILNKLPKLKKENKEKLEVYPVNEKFIFTPYLRGHHNLCDKLSAHVHESETKVPISAHPITWAILSEHNPRFHDIKEEFIVYEQHIPKTKTLDKAAQLLIEQLKKTIAK